MTTPDQPIAEVRTLRSGNVFVFPNTFPTRNRQNGGKGIGKGGKKRMMRLRSNLDGITKPAIKRLARRGGVKRLSGLVYNETRLVLHKFLRDIVGTAVQYTECGQRKTVTAMDVILALKSRGHTLYGFS